MTELKKQKARLEELSNNISERLIAIIVFVTLFEFVVDQEYFILYIRKRSKKGEA